MFNPELVGVLCEKISSETDPRKLLEFERPFAGRHQRRRGRNQT